jgi:hypothetical protein
MANKDRKILQSVNKEIEKQQKRDNKSYQKKVQDEIKKKKIIHKVDPSSVNEY